LDAKELLKALRLNIAQSYIKLNKYYDAIDNCNKVLKDDPSNLKALYRRGTAFRKN
jgi:Tfp pilus assembly protein PilF